MLAWIIAAVFAFLGLLHFYWALAGVGDANHAAIPQINGVPVFKPSKAATAGVGVELVVHEVPIDFAIGALDVAVEGECRRFVLHLLPMLLARL